jgi:hypothetical protein
LAINLTLKIYKMKNIKYLLIAIFTVATVVSCIDEDNDALTGDAITGGLVNINNELVSYVVSSGATYTATGSILQGEVQTNKLEIYNQLNYQVFFKNVDNKDSIVTRKTNKVLLETIDINATIGLTNKVSISFDYADLIVGLTKEDNSSVSSDDTDLSVGDFWELTYVSTTSEGNVVQNSKLTKVAIGTRYAGVYTVAESEYWNSGGLQSGDWNGQEVIIESVNASIYRHKGLAYWDDNEYYFTVDSSTGVITTLDTDLAGAGSTLNGSPIMTCKGGTGAFESVSCDDTTSLATPDDTNGLDQLEFTVGYFRGVGATREFYEKLVKKVD